MYQRLEFDADGQPTSSTTGHSGFSRRRFLMTGTAAVTTAALSSAALAQVVRGPGESQTKFRRIPTQFIAALGEPSATAGDNAQLWGLWRRDPGPRGVRLNRYELLKAAGGIAPAQWQFDAADWWLEEHGLIMEQPEFPLAPGKYRVTGDREATAVLTVHPKDTDGRQRWELDGGTTLYDVTHLACRSARYTPAGSDTSCSPAKAQAAAFPVSPGAEMPPVESCNKQDYAVLIVFGVALDDGN